MRAEAISTAFSLWHIQQQIDQHKDMAFDITSFEHIFSLAPVCFKELKIFSKFSLLEQCELHGTKTF